MKLWRLPAPGQVLPSVPGLVLGPEPVQVEVLQFHPTADGVLASAAGMAVKVWDVAKQQALTGTRARQPLSGRHSVTLGVRTVNFRVCVSVGGRVVRF